MNLKKQIIKFSKKLNSTLITEKGVCNASKEGLEKLFK